MEVLTQQSAVAMEPLAPDRRSQAVGAARALVKPMVTLLLLLVATFALTTQVSPETVARINLPDSQRGTPENVAAYIAEHDLDGSIPSRFASYMSGLARLDLGTSQLSEVPVWDTISAPLARSLIVSVTAFGITVPLSVLLSLWLARRTQRPVGRFVDMAVIWLSAVPSFVIGVGLVYLFAILLGVLPANSSIGIAFGGPADKALAYVLPVIITVVVSVPYLVRIGRSIFIEVLAAPHTRSAVLRGLSTRVVLWKYSVPAALSVLAQFMFIVFVNILSGVIVVENITGLPGIGRLLVQSVVTGDAFVTMGGVLTLGIVVVAASMASELVSARLNPDLARRAA